MLMSLTLPVGLMLVGIVLLIQGGNWTIDSAVYIAKHLGLSPLIVGFTVLAFGTSLPELIVSIMAAMRGSMGIAMGNVIGSNIANILLVIGAASVFVPLCAHFSKALLRDLAMMLLCSGILLGLMLYSEISRLAGVGMVGLLVGYIFVQYKMAHRGDIGVDELEKETARLEEDAEEHVSSSRMGPYVFLFFGLLAIAGGAEFLVRGAKDAALILGVPEAVIALSIIAFGTSLPELSTSIIAGRKGHTDMVLGNIIGSNVFNILMILGVTSFVKPIVSGSYAPQLLDFDIWLMLAVSLFFAFILILYKKVTRPIGLAFIGMYIAYNVYIYALYLGA